MTLHREEAFGSWLGRQIRRAGKTQVQLAEELGLTRAAVSAWITGRAEPREETKRLIAKALNTDPASIYNLTDVTAELPLQWHFRPAHADGGREYGNAAAFAFDADLSVLAREATQNSLDERVDTTRPVLVRYTLHEVSGEHRQAFLNAVHWNELSEHYRQAAVSEQKVARSLRAALNDLWAEDKSLVLLRVDDYNAAGLTGPEYADGRFAAVVRRQLDSHKQSGNRAGGSYGLGKATLWATSRFSLVLINSTLSELHEGHTRRRLIGRLDLPWHEVDGKLYAGPAWFGQPDTEPEHKDVSRSWWSDEQTARDLCLERPGDDPGTSFLIVGAHDASGDAETLQEMHEKLVKSLAHGFWAAMVGGKTAGPLLDARVTALRNGQVLIPEEKVDPHSHHPTLSRALQAYLDEETVDGMTASDQVARADVRLLVSPLKGQRREQGKGREHAAVLLLTPAGDNDDKTNRVVCMRGNRMTVTEQRPRDLPLGTPPFQAVLLAGYATGRAGDDVDHAERFLRASEPPEHDRWDRTEELTSLYERGALSRLKEFRADIDRVVRELVGRRETKRSGGPSALRELLKLDGPGAGGTRRSQSTPTVRIGDARVEDTGAWRVVVDLRLPDAEDPWLLTPVAKFDVRSGGRPAVDWASLTAVENCRVENGNLVVEPGIRSVGFIGVTDPGTHPVRGRLSRLVVDIQKARGGAA
jgi:transcriptional regulator with XRE-family HTH domain